MTDSYDYSPKPVPLGSTFTLTYTASKILVPFSNYDLLTEDNTILSNFNPTYTVCKGTGIANPIGMDIDANGIIYLINDATRSIITVDNNTTQGWIYLNEPPFAICVDRIHKQIYILIQSQDDLSFYVNKYDEKGVQDTSFTLSNINNAVNMTIGNNILYVSSKNIITNVYHIITYNANTGAEIQIIQLANNIVYSAPATLNLNADASILYFSYNNILPQSFLGQITLGSSPVINYNIFPDTFPSFVNIVYSSLSDYLYIMDLDNSDQQTSTIYKIDMNDNTIYTIETNISNPGGIVVNPNNSVLYYASEIFKIYEYKNGSSSITIDSSSGINGPSGIIFVNDSAFVANETLFVVNQYNQTISAVVTDGSVSEFVSPNAGLQAPIAIAYVNQYLYVTQPNVDNGQISKIDKNGNIETNNINNNSFKPLGILYKSFSNGSSLLFVTEQDENGNSIVVTYDILNEYTRAIFLDATYGLQNAGGICFDSNNTLYICNSVNPGFISTCKCNEDGTIHEFNLNYQTVNLEQPAGIVSDEYNNIYFANAYQGGVISLSAVDPNVIEPPPPPLVPTVFCNSQLIQNPFGIALDETGNLFIANFASFSIIKANTHNLNFINIESKYLQLGFNNLHINDPFNLIDIQVEVVGPISNICFHKNTPIETDQGIIPIRYLDSKRHTIQGKRIIAITKTHSLDTHLVQIKRDALGYNCPSQATILTRNHHIYYRGYKMAAGNLVGRKRGVSKISYNKHHFLYNIVMEKYDTIVVNNMLCETLDPENLVAQVFISSRKQIPKRV